MKEYYISPYHYEQNVHLQPIIARQKKIITIYGNESAILRALAKYRILNRSLIADVLNEMLPQKRQKKSYDPEIKNLFEGCYLVKYSYPLIENGRNNIVAYSLANKGITYVKEKKIPLYYEVQSNTYYATSTILEVLALNTWHIRLHNKYKNSIIQSYYEFPIRLNEYKSTILPSCIRFENPSWDMLKNFSLVTLSFCKDRTPEGEGAFLNTLLAVNAVSRQDRRFKKMLIVILVDQLEQMNEATALLKSKLHLSKIHTYFALDEYANDEEPLRWLFEVTLINQNETSYKVIDLTKK